MNNIWVDRYNHQPVSLPAISISAPEEARVSAPEEATDDGLGRGSEGNIRCDRGPRVDYKMSMGYTKNLSRS